MELLIDHFINYLAVEKGLSRNTLEAYSRDLIKYTDYLSKKRIKDLNQTSDLTVMTFVSGLKKAGLSNRSIARNLTVIKLFYKFLTDEHHITSNPTLNIDSPKRELKLPTILRMDEVDTLPNMPDSTTTTGHCLPGL